MPSNDNKTRRPKGDHACFWSEERQRWVAQASVGFDHRGKRRYISRVAESRTAALKALREAIREHRRQEGLKGSASYTVGEAVEDWFRYSRTGLDPSTTKRDRTLVDRHVLPFLGEVRLRKLTTRHVEDWLLERRGHVAQRTLGDIASLLRRAIDRAQRNTHVDKNVAALAEIPEARRPGRPSRSMSTKEATAILKAQSMPKKMRAYIVLSIVTGIRVEEARALRWGDVHFGADDSDDDVSFIRVVRSVRRRGDTKTRQSRRAVALPKLAVDVLEEWKAITSHGGEADLVFCTRTGQPFDNKGLRTRFRAALRTVPGIDDSEWTPRELRHTFVSLMSDSGASAEVIALLVGHAGTRTTEQVYRHQLTPVVRAGAELMDRLTN